MRNLVKSRVPVATNLPNASCARSSAVYGGGLGSVGSLIPSGPLVCPTAFCASVAFSGPGLAPSSKFPAEFTRHRPRVCSGAVDAA